MTEKERSQLDEIDSLLLGADAEITQVETEADRLMILLCEENTTTPRRTRLSPFEKGRKTA